MNDTSAHSGALEKTSGRRPHERSTATGLLWTDVECELEIRERLVAIVDALDAGAPDTARVNAAWLLDDLDEAERAS